MYFSEYFWTDEYLSVTNQGLMSKKTGVWLSRKNLWNNKERQPGEGTQVVTETPLPVSGDESWEAENGNTRDSLKWSEGESKEPE